MDPKTGVAIFVAQRDCVAGLDGLGAVVMEQWERQKTMRVLKRKVTTNF